MSFQSKVLYTGNGVTTQYNIPFPYIAQGHIDVYLNTVLQLSPMHYSISGSTVTFVDPVPQDDAIEIQRKTSPDNILVDFQDGSVLNERDLDLGYLHNFYLSQEANDGFNQLVNETLVRIGTGAGILDTETADIINALVAQLLQDDAAATLQARVADIDTNAESIIQLGSGLQVQINTLAQGVAAQVYVQAGEPSPGVSGVPDPIPEGARWYDSDDNNEAYIYIDSEWVTISDPRVGTMVSQISVIQTDVDDNAAAVVSEQVARSTADTAFASELGLLGAQNGAETAFILDSSTVKLDSNSGDTVATRLSQLATADSTNASAITTEESARITADGVNASAISALDTRVTTAEGDVVANASAIDLTEADIVTNAGNITTQAAQITALQSSVNLRARTYYQSTAPTADNVGDLWIDSDDDSLNRWNGTSWVSIEDAAIAGNASAITGLDTRVTTAEGSIVTNASSITTLNASVTTLDGEMNTAQVDIIANAAVGTTNAGDVTTLEAKYGVKLDVNGYVTGFVQNNDGETGNFVIMADNFAIQEPGETTGDGNIPFSVTSGVTRIQNVVIAGGLIDDATITNVEIRNGTIGGIDIDDLAVDTGNITNNAVTDIVTTEATALLNISRTYLGRTTVRSATINVASGNKVLVMGKCHMTVNWSPRAPMAERYNWEVRRGTTSIGFFNYITFRSTAVGGAPNYYLSPPTFHTGRDIDFIVDTPGAGNFTYNMDTYCLENPSTATSAYVNDRALLLMEIKK